MKPMQSFLIFFYILDQCYFQCEEDDLGGLLGAISPELWADGKPMDMAIFNDWQKKSNPETIDASNIIERTYDFLEYYEKEFGFNFFKTKKCLLTITDKVLEESCNKTHIMYQKYHYDN